MCCLLDRSYALDMFLEKCLQVKACVRAAKQESSIYYLDDVPHHSFPHRIKSRASNDNLVTCAVEAATAYENIINAIKAADAAATRATNAADLALSVSILQTHDNGRFVL